jgi:hypothetical protein
MRVLRCTHPSHYRKQGVCHASKVHSKGEKTPGKAFAVRLFQRTHGKGRTTPICTVNKVCRALCRASKPALGNKKETNVRQPNRWHEHTQFICRALSSTHGKEFFKENKKQRPHGCSHTGLGSSRGGAAAGRRILHPPGSPAPSRRSCQHRSSCRRRLPWDVEVEEGRIRLKTSWRGRRRGVRLKLLATPPQPRMRSHLRCVPPPLIRAAARALRRHPRICAATPHPSGAEPS